MASDHIRPVLDTPGHTDGTCQCCNVKRYALKQYDELLAYLDRVLTELEYQAGMTTSDKEHERLLGILSGLPDFLRSDTET